MKRLGLKICAPFSRSAASHRHPHSKDAMENYLLLTRAMKLPDAECHARLEPSGRRAGLDEASFRSAVAGSPCCCQRWMAPGR